jgi:hypothetical protein
MAFAWHAPSVELLIGHFAEAASNLHWLTALAWDGQWISEPKVERAWKVIAFHTEL